MNLIAFYNSTTARTRFFIGIFILMIANIGFSSKAVLIKIMYLYHVDTISVIALRMLFSVPFYIIIAYFLSKREDNVRLTVRE